MNFKTVFSTFFVALAALSWVQVAKADSLEATCEVRKDGEKQKGKSGPCTFGQRQGYIDIDLRNGDTVSLSPTNQANHFKDQKGNKVVRTGTGSARQEYKWEGGKHLIVTFATSPSYGGASAAGYGAGNGSAEYRARVKLPSDIRRYVKATFTVPADAGTNTAYTFTVSLLTCAKP
jgi:hypothetical protein